MRRNIFCDNAAGTNHRSAADCDAADDCNVSCDPAVVAYGNRFCEFVIKMCIKDRVTVSFRLEAFWQNRSKREFEQFLDKLGTLRGVIDVKLI